MKSTVVCMIGLGIIVASIIGFIMIDKESLMFTTEFGFLLLLWSALMEKD